MLCKYATVNFLRVFIFVWRLRVAVDQHAQYKVQWLQQRKEKDEAIREKEHLIKELEEKYNSFDDQVCDILVL